MDTPKDFLVEMPEPLVPAGYFGIHPKTPGFRKWCLTCRYSILITFVLVVWIFLLWTTIGFIARMLLLLISTSIVLLSEILWRRMKFCLECRALICHPISGENEIWCPGCGRLVNPASIILDKPGFVDIGKYVNHKDPYVKVLGLLIKFCLAAQVNELRMEPKNNHYDLYTKDSEKFFEMVPTPEGTKRYFLQAIQAITGIYCNCDKHQSSEFNIKEDDREIRAIILIESTKLGEIINVHFG